MKKSKLNIVFLHGFGEDASVWKDFIKQLSKGNKYFCPDFSIKSDCETMNEYAYWLKQELDNKELNNICLVGHSMGGYVALAFADLFPEMVAGLSLFHSTSFADSEERKNIRLKAIDFIDKHGSAEFIKDFFPNMFSEEFRLNNKAFIQKKIKQYSKIPKEALITATKAMRTRVDKQAILEKSNFPLLFIAGEKDKFVPIETIYEQIDLTPKPYYLILPTTAHAGMYEDTDKCVEKLSAFIEIVNNR